MEREIDYTVERKVSFTIRSSDASQIQNSTYEIDYTLRPLHIPSIARNVHLTLDYAQIPHRSYNINSTNNKIRIFGPNSADVGTDFDITVPEGIYNHEELSLYIERDLFEQGAKSTSGALAIFEHFIPNNTTVITLNYATVVVKFGDLVNTTMTTILGFDAVNTGAGASVPFYIYSQNEHQLRHIDSYYIHMNIIRGLRINNNYFNCIGQIPINVAAGETIYYIPNNRQFLTGDNLINQEVNSVRFWLTSDGQTVINLNDDDYEFSYSVHYTIPHNHEWDERTNQV